MADESGKPAPKNDSVPGAGGGSVPVSPTPGAGTAPSSVSGGTYAPGTLGNFKLDHDKLDPKDSAEKP